jgi:hypothetical protein
MEPTHESPTVKLIQTRLKRAQEALSANNLEEAQNFFNKALVLKEHSPDLVFDIRKVVKQYSDQVVEQPPPNWDLAYRALELLGSLKLQDDETRTWEYDLKLKQAQFLLGKGENLDESFNIFADLMVIAEQQGVQDKLKADIAHIVRIYVSQRAPQQEWSLLGRVFKRVSKMWTADNGLNDWLESISKTLEAAVQAQAEHIQRLEKIEQSLRRTRFFLWAVLIIFILSVVAYILVSIL